MIYYVYLIQSGINGAYYIGQTNDVKKRLKRHNNGEIFSTKGKKPWKLIKFETFATRSESMWREHQIKTNKKIKANFIVGD